MRELSWKSLPTRRAAWSYWRILTVPKMRFQKAFHNFRMTLICGLVTFLVLRGTLGAGKFGTPGQDFNEIRSRLPGGQRTMMEFDVAKVDEADWAKAETAKFEKHFDSAEYFDPKTVHHILGEPVKDWDVQRSNYNLRIGMNGSKTFTASPRILLVSGSQPKACGNPKGDHLLLKSLKNKVDYCRMHGIEIFYNMAHFGKEMSGFWAKLPLIRKLMLSHPDIEWIWWMDSDAFFTDMKFELPMEKYEGYNLVVHGWEDLLYEQKSWIGLNTGSFLIRNCQWSLDILDSWAPYGPVGKPRTEAGKLFTNYLSGRPEFEADDQSALIYLLLSQKERWTEKTYLENSYFLHGYWVVLVESFQQLLRDFEPGHGDDRWPLVTHFVGCKPCHGFSGEYSSDRCTKEMERAFNFADNQVLQVFGYHHSELESHDVTKTIPTELTTPKFLRGTSEATSQN